MNKMMKGSIAGATGVALLMGGFGTYALWSDSEDLSAGTVQSGELDIATSAGAWDDANSAASNDWSSSDLMVPGDTVTYTQTFTVTGTGKNMQGTISYVEPAKSGPLGVTTDVAVNSDNTDVVATATPGNFTFSKPFGSATLTAVVTYTLPSTAGNGAQDKSATLPAAAFTIQQS